MKKVLAAVLIAAVTAGILASGSVIYMAQDDASLQIAGDNQAEETQDVDEASTQDTISLPNGDIENTDLTDITDEQIENSGVADVAENVMPAMVSITNTSVQEVESWFRGGSMQYESTSLGTGVIMGENDSELLIVTNNHVVEDANELTVTFIDENSVSAEVKGTDAGNDLAVVAVDLGDIDKSTLGQIRIARVADSDDVKVGEQVVAIGNALGYGQSVTTGIVSALDRTVSVQDGYTITDYEDLIQTDAAINAGNSGGALLNMKGEVIGINSVKAGATGVEGMGYAIPTSKALPIIQKLMNKETREKVSDDDLPYLGITGQDVTTSVAQVYGLPQGIYVTDVGEGTPAEEAGITQGMIITKFDDNEITSMSELQELLQYYKGGETVTITVATQGQNGYEEQDLSITLGLRSDYISSTQ